MLKGLKKKSEKLQRRAGDFSCGNSKYMICVKTCSIETCSENSIMKIIEKDGKNPRGEDNRRQVKNEVLLIYIRK